MKKIKRPAANGSNRQPKRLQELGNYSKRNEQERLAELPKVQVYNGRRDHSVNTDLKNIWQRQEFEWVDAGGHAARSWPKDGLGGCRMHLVFHQLGHPQLSRPMAHRRNAENGIQQNRACRCSAGYQTANVPLTWVNPVRVFALLVGARTLILKRLKR